MKRIAMTLACLASVALVLGSQAGDAKKLDPEKILGNWTYVEGTKNGEKVPAEHLKGVVKFEKGKIVVPGEQADSFIMAYTIDASKSPAAVDMTVEKAPFKEAVGSAASGIIVLEGETLKLAYTEGKTRPTSFESTKENKVHTFVLKRAK